MYIPSLQQQSNIAKTAIKLLQSIDIKFSMKYYCQLDTEHPLMKGKSKNFLEEFNQNLAVRTPLTKEINECGTTCCFAGFGPVALKNTKKAQIGWDEYIEDTSGISEYDNTMEWTFLFSSQWNDSKHQAAARALWYLKQYPIEPFFDNHEELLESYHRTSTNFFDALSDKELIKELKKFT